MERDFTLRGSDFIEAHPRPVQVAVEAPPGPRKTLPLVLFALTCLTTLYAGWSLNQYFVAMGPESGLGVGLLSGFPFAFSILSVLVAHEMGHFLACRFYGIDATYPYFLPAPPQIMFFGTFGAVIRIRSQFRSRRQLFDVGIAGPLAGFVALLPVAVIGVLLSSDYQGPLGGTVIEFGEPLLFQLTLGLFYSGNAELINLHPVGWAAWFGMLATGLNLLPIGQLDGGHIVYALFGERWHRWISWATWGGLVLLSVLSWPSVPYLGFALLLLIFRLRHPRPYSDDPLRGRNRLIVALIGATVFVLTFMPIPIRIVEHWGRL